MDYELHVIVEKVSISSQAIVKRDTIKRYDIKEPESILDLGLRHKEQISLLAKVQNALLAEQTILIDLGFTGCPKCGAKLSKNGFMQSKFHAVFSDHKLRLQKHCCKNPDCNWQSTPTISRVFGTDTHPDLVKLQCEQSAFNSYRIAQANLEKLNGQRRSVNNPVQLQQVTNRIGARLSQENQTLPSQTAQLQSAQELVVQVEEGYISTKDADNPYSRVLLGAIYRLNRSGANDPFLLQRADRRCVVSALDDDQQTMKRYLLNAALRQGLSHQTHIFALADGTSTCWSLLSTLVSHCQTIESVLDWFHIATVFEMLKPGLSRNWTRFLDRVQLILWQGDAETALGNLAFIKNNIADEAKREQIQALQDYLEMNLPYLVHYADWSQANKPFTSQGTDFHINEVIHSRNSKKRTMQWTQQGAHNVLQLRSLIASQDWEAYFYRLNRSE